MAGVENEIPDLREGPAKGGEAGGVGRRYGLFFVRLLVVWCCLCILWCVVCCLLVGCVLSFVVSVLSAFVFV